MDIRPQTLHAALIGKGIQGSLTPAMHIAEGRAQGFEYRYDLIDTALPGAEQTSLAAMLQEAENNGFCGLNITHPYKQQIIPDLHSLSKEAEILQAVNTVVLKDGRRHGHNTDWWGFAEGFRRGLPDADLRHVMQLGAGGAGAATAFAILKLGASSLGIFDQDENRAALLATSMSRHFPDANIKPVTSLADSMLDATGLIHATPTGMDKYPGLPLPADLLRPDIWVSEIVYFPLETALLAEARRLGCRTVDGGGMAVFQAVGAFQLFTGRKADSARMICHFRSLTTQPVEKTTISGGAG